MRSFFNLTKRYTFEWGDITAILTIINVVAIIAVGLVASWLGLAIAIFGLVLDLAKDRKLNGLAIHLAMVALNTYFLLLCYGMVK